MTEMPETEKSPEVQGLEPFFAAARQQGRQPSQALLARVLADAEAAQPAPQAAVPRVQPGRLTQAWARLWRGLPTAAGLASATMAGVWLGFVSPDAVLAIETALTGGADAGFAAEALAGLDEFLSEG